MDGYAITRARLDDLEHVDPAEDDRPTAYALRATRHILCKTQELLTLNGNYMPRGAVTVNAWGGVYVYWHHPDMTLGKLVQMIVPPEEDGAHQIYWHDEDDSHGVVELNAVDLADWLERLVISKGDPA